MGFGGVHRYPRCKLSFAAVKDFVSTLMQPFILVRLQVGVATALMSRKYILSDLCDSSHSLARDREALIGPKRHRAPANPLYNFLVSLFGQWAQTRSAPPHGKEGSRTTNSLDGAGITERGRR